MKKNSDITNISSDADALIKKESKKTKNASDIETSHLAEGIYTMILMYCMSKLPLCYCIVMECTIKAA